MKKKLLIVTTVPLTIKSILTGQPKFLSEFFDVEVISSGAVELSQVADIEQVRTHKVDMKREIRPLQDLVSLFCMIRLLWTIKPDVVHSYTPKAGLVTMLAAFLCRVPVRVHTFTGLIFPTTSGLKRNMFIWIDRLICACATIIVPEGEGVKKDLLKHGITCKKLDVIGNGNIAGVDIDFFDKTKVLSNVIDLKEAFGLPPDSFVFCFVGRFTSDKGIKELLSAFFELSEQAFLLLVGSQDERLPLSEDLVDQMNRHPRIFQTGWVSDVRPALAVSDVLVLPSYREGFPNSPLQAGSMKLPCIVTDISGSNEVIVDGMNGWIISPRSVSELSEAMIEAMNSKVLDEMGVLARKNIEQKFEKLAYLECLKKFYQQLVK